MVISCMVGLIVVFSQSAVNSELLIQQQQRNISSLLEAKCQLCLTLPIVSKAWNTKVLTYNFLILIFCNRWPSLQYVLCLVLVRYHLCFVASGIACLSIFMCQLLYIAGFFIALHLSENFQQTCPHQASRGCSFGVSMRFVVFVLLPFLFTL